MAIIREIDNSDSVINFGTLALLCGILCTIIMLRLRGFKASLNFSSNRKSGVDHYSVPEVSVSGAYRTSREEYFGVSSYSSNPPKKITPSMVQLPPATNHTGPVVTPSKSTNDLSRPANLVPDLRKSAPDLSAPPQVNPRQNLKDKKNQDKEQKKLEKQRIAEQKKRDKLAAQERQKQEKLRKEREKQAAQQQAREAKLNKDRDRNAPSKKAVPQAQLANPLSQRPVQNSTNTLESSISKSSGPPPYFSDEEPVVIRKADNVTYGQSLDETSSWDMVSQHRQQINRPAASTREETMNRTKQMQLDMNYNFGNSSRDDRAISDA